MELVCYLAKSGFILLGIISLLVGKYISLKIIMPNKEKYKMIDEKKYVEYIRRIYVIGFYYTLVGIVLLFINGWPTIVSIAGTWILTLLLLVISRNRRKYIERIND